MSEPADKLLGRLEELGIEARTVRHAPVFTVEQAKAERGELEGAHIKNLFLRNKKGRMWLVVALEDRAIDLKRLGQRLGAGHVSFASPERLERYLGVEPGAVTPFGVLHDAEGAVTVVLDRGVLEHAWVNAHPLQNDMTTAIRSEDLLAFLRACDHEPEIIDLTEP